MIKNERQYRITRTQAEKFEQALKQLADEPQEGIHPLLRQAQADGLQSQLDSLHAELLEYERLQSGTVSTIQVHQWSDIPRTLIQARIAAGLTQRELAERLDVHEQQIQRYEDSEYLGASLARIMEVAQALGLELRGEGYLSRGD